MRITEIQTKEGHLSESNMLRRGPPTAQIPGRIRIPRAPGNCRRFLRAPGKDGDQGKMGLFSEII